MLEEVPLLVGCELVVERYEHATAIKDRVRRDQPFGLIRHNDRRAIAGLETGFLQRFREWMRALLEAAIRDALFLAIAVGFDQACFRGELIQRILQRGADGLILGELEHYKRD